MPPPAIYAELQQRLAQRDSLLALCQQVRNQLHALEHAPVVIAAVRGRMEALITTLSAQIAEVEAEIAPALQQDDAWVHAAARLQSIKGIGLLTAAWLLVTTLNFTACPTAEAATAYAGLVPYGGDSGTSVHKRPRIGHTGNARLRTALYRATLSAARTNPPLRTFYTRLRTAGKPPKVARCAVARKLLRLAWVVVTKDCAFDPAYGPRRPR
jgi:transposase